MNPDCTFCRVLAGDPPAEIVFRDEHLTAFLDRAPINPGHTIIVPNRHVVALDELDFDTGGHMFQVGQRIARGLHASSLRAEGINMWLADGAAAFQEVFHAHLHVFPRFRGDGFSIRRRSWLPADQSRLVSAAAELRRALDALAPPAS